MSNYLIKPFRSEESLRISCSWFKLTAWYPMAGGFTTQRGREKITQPFNISTQLQLHYSLNISFQVPAALSDPDGQGVHGQDS